MDFKGIVNAMFYKKDWPQVTTADKDAMFFIFNRYMAKKYPKQAQYFNDKSIDKASCMDIWFQFMKKEVRVPVWFWSGPTKKKDPPIKDWKVVQDFWKMSINDIYILCEVFPNEMKEEIKRIQLINEEQAK